MKANSKNNTLSILIPILLAIFIAKAFWVAISYKYLPKSGIDLNQELELAPLYYRYSLASKKEAPKAIVKPHKIVKHTVSKPKNQEIKKFILKGIYYSKSKKIATLEYLGKTYILEIGDELKGFKLTKVMPEYIVFKKDGQEYEINIFTKQAQTPIKQTTQYNTNISSYKKIAKKQADIRQEGDTTIISKNIFNKYRNNVNSIRKYIGGVPIIRNNKLHGFRISYIKKGSDFDKLGLKRGDIITAINGEEITDLSVPMRFINNLDSITAATITVKRGNEVKELEYEVH